MKNFILYLVPTLIWGSTWLGIKLQLTQVPPILSVAYRFCLASLILLIYCLLTNKKLNFSRYDHKFMALQGFTLFGLGYCMSYLSTAYLTIFGSVVAFGCYMLLIGRIGAEYAAYVLLLVPVLALLLSTIFENYHWTVSGVLGLVLVLIGNLVILTQPQTVIRIFRRMAL